MDLNGDGLPDKVFKKDGVLRWRKNLGWNPELDKGFFENSLAALPVVGINDISRDRSTTWSAGAEGHPSGGSVYANFSQTISKGSVYFTDANGDGFLDLVDKGTVKFGSLVGGVPTFSTDSNNTPVPVDSGTVNHQAIVEDMEAIFHEQIKDFPLADTLRRWVAPWEGRIKIVAPVKLIQDTSPERAESTTADGVRLAIQKNGSELWTLVIAEDDYTEKSPTNVDSITVSRGDRVYFRVGSVLQGLFDRVEWNPEIVYTHVMTGTGLVAAPSPPILDQNGRDVHRYQALEDWTFAGRRDLAFPAPITGTIRLEGDFEKLGQTTDDIRLQILKDGVEVYGQNFAWDATETLAIIQNVEVVALEKIEVRLKIDSQIDVTKIRFAPKLFYVLSSLG